MVWFGVYVAVEFVLSSLARFRLCSALFYVCAYFFVAPAADGADDGAFATILSVTKLFLTCHTFIQASMHIYHDSAFAPFKLGIRMNWWNRFAYTVLLCVSRLVSISFSFSRV